MVGELVKEVSVHGSEGYLSFIDSFVEDIRTSYKLDEEIVSNIIISMSEAMNNAFLHGNRGDVSLPIHIKVYFLDSMLSFAITDKGEGFDYGLLRDDLSEELLDIPGGRGIFIMRALADEVRFNEIGNETILKFRCA